MVNMLLNIQEAVSDSIQLEFVRMSDSYNVLLSRVLWLFVLVCILILLILFMGYKMYYMNRRLRNINHKLNEIKNQVSTLKDYDDLHIENQRDVFLNQREEHRVTHQEVLKQPSSLKDEKNNNERKSHKEMKNIVRKFANIQSPDHDGNLKIAERSMQDVMSDTKPFIVEYEQGKTTASYTINPSAVKVVLNELQTYEYCFKSVIINRGGVQNISQIIPIKSGRLEKRGTYWFVTEKMDVKFK